MSLVDMYIHLGVTTLTPSGVIEDIHYAVIWGTTMEDALPESTKRINQVMENISEGIHPSRVQVVHAECIEALDFKIPGVNC